MRARNGQLLIAIDQFDGCLILQDEATKQRLADHDPGLENKVVEEASDVDDLPGLIRPITLNMMGLILRSFAGAALTMTAPGRLIHEFLRRAIEKLGIDHAAPNLLAQMITDK